MVQRRLYAFLLAFLLQPALAAEQQTVPDFLNGNQLKNPKEKTQDVLEHKPVTEPSCEQFVRSTAVARTDKAVNACSLSYSRRGLLKRPHAISNP